MSIQREFPSYDDMKGFADLLAKLPGFVDSSWHNDTCPSMEHEESHTKIWVEYADPDNRENAGPRFSIEQGELLGEADCVFSTDDAALVVEWVKNGGKTVRLCSPKTYGKLEVTTKERYHEMLGCVPPAHRAGERFAVGEAYADRWQFDGEFSAEDQYNAVFDCYYEIDGTFLHGYFTIKDYKAVTIEQLRAATGKLTPDKCGASQLACNIVNNTFLSLDGFAALRKQMAGTEYTAEHFGAELARIVDRELKDVTGSLKALLDWGRDHTSPIQDNSPHDLLVAAHNALEFCSIKPQHSMRHITVYMSDGDTISTNINGTDEEIMNHYLGNRFEAGSDTKHHVALCIHFHDTDKRYGLRIKCIEHTGVSGCISHVRKDKVKIDDNNSYEEIMLVTRSDAEYALNDVWVYDMDGFWIEGIGYKHATT